MKKKKSELKSAEMGQMYGTEFWGSGSYEEKGSRIHYGTPMSLG